MSAMNFHGFSHDVFINALICHVKITHVWYRFSHTKIFGFTTKHSQNKVTNILDQKWSKWSFSKSMIFMFIWQDGSFYCHRFYYSSICVYIMLTNSYLIGSSVLLRGCYYYCSDLEISLIKQINN